jgi:hypothetical protein
MGLIIGIGLYLILGIAITILQMIPFRDLKKFNSPEGKVALGLLSIFIVLVFPVWLIYVGVQLMPKTRTKKLLKRIANEPYRDNVLRQLDQAHKGKGNNIPKDVPRPHRAQAEFIGSKSRYVFETRHQHRRTEN